MKDIAALLMPWVGDLMPRITATPEYMRDNRIVLLAFATGGLCSQLYNCLQGNPPHTPVPESPDGRCYASYQGFSNGSDALAAIRKMANGSGLGVQIPATPAKAVAFVCLAYESSSVWVVQQSADGRVLLDDTLCFGKTRWDRYDLN
jgi:hypothetical protein